MQINHLRLSATPYTSSIAERFAERGGELVESVFDSGFTTRFVAHRDSTNGIPNGDRLSAQRAAIQKENREIATPGPFFENFSHLNQ